MRASYAVHRINGWFIRLGFGRTAADDFVRQLAGDSHHWTGQLVAATCYAALGVARLVLKGLAVVSHATSMHLSRQAEFDADRRSARIVSSDAMATALEAMPYLAVAGDLATAQAQAGWAKRQLPDDLVVMTRAYALAMPVAVRRKVEAGVLSADARWFDTHPPLFRRIAVLKRAADPGVLRVDAPAAVLFRDFDELCKLATIGMYQASPIGPKLKPEHLVPAVVPADPVPVDPPGPPLRRPRPR